MPSSVPSYRLEGEVRNGEGRAGRARGRAYELDENVDVDVFEGSRQFDALCGFHPPIAASKSASCPGVYALFPTR